MNVMSASVKHYEKLCDNSKQNCGDQISFFHFSVFSVLTYCHLLN